MRKHATGWRGMMDDVRRIVNAIQGLPRLMLNQGAADGAILESKSSDVAHGATHVADTDTFFLLQKDEAPRGGAELRGLKAAGGVSGAAMSLRGYLAKDADTTKAVTSRGIVEIVSYQTDGAGFENIVANGNIFAIRCWRGGGLATVLIVDEDGDLHLDGAVAAYDGYNDAVMAQDLAHVMSGEYNKLIEYNRPALEAAGVIGPQDASGRFMLSTKRTTALLLGAAGQLHQRMQAQDERIAQLEQALSEKDDWL